MPATHNALETFRKRQVSRIRELKRAIFIAGAIVASVIMIYHGRNDSGTMFRAIVTVMAHSREEFIEIISLLLYYTY